MKNLRLILSLGLASAICQAGRPIQLEDYYRVESASTPCADVQIPSDVVDEVLAAVGQVKSSSDGGRIPNALS